MKRIIFMVFVVLFFSSVTLTFATSVAEEGTKNKQKQNSPAAMKIKQKTSGDPHDGKVKQNSTARTKVKQKASGDTHENKVNR